MKPKQYIAEVRISSRGYIECWRADANDRSSIPDPEHFGGYFTYSVSGTGGTQASGASIIQYQMNFVPWDGPIPHHEVYAQYKAQLLETKPEIRNKLTTDG